MVLRVILFTVSGLAATLGMASVAPAAEMAKEGTCHFRSSLTGSGKLNMIGTLQDGGNGLAVFDETGTVVTDCGQGKLPPSNQHCFGTSEMRKGFMYTTGYCITTDPDRSQVAWKVVFDGYDKYSYDYSGTQEALIGSGKYEGMAAKGKLSCSYKGDRVTWTDSCEGDFSYKRK